MADLKKIDEKIKQMEEKREKNLKELERLEKISKMPLRERIKEPELKELFESCYNNQKKAFQLMIKREHKELKDKWEELFNEFWEDFLNEKTKNIAEWKKRFTSEEQEKSIKSQQI